MNKVSSVKFKGHESFALRRGWIYKGLVAVADNTKWTEFDSNSTSDEFTLESHDFDSTPKTDIFLSSDVTIELGLGSNMCKALRYYLRATGLTEEKRASNGKKYTVLTEFGKFVYANDPYLRFNETIAFLHLNLVQNLELATAWHLIFAEIDGSEVSRKDLVTAAHFMMHENNLALVSDKSIEDDFTCISTMYAGNLSRGLNAITDPENLIKSPFTQLGLINYGTSNDSVIKEPMQYHLVSEHFWMGAILSNFVGSTEVQIEDLYIPQDSVGRAFNLSRTSILKIVDELDRKGLIRTVRTSGLDVIRLTDNKEITNELVNQCFQKCYTQRKEEELIRHEY